MQQSLGIMYVESLGCSTVVNDRSPRKFASSWNERSGRQ